MSNEKEYTYIEIVNYGSGKCTSRIDVSGKSESQIARVDRGANINLNHEDYYTITRSYSKPKPLQA